MLYAITHGERSSEPNPAHTAEGLKQIASMSHKLVDYNLAVSFVVTGTGKRFIEIHQVLQQLIPNFAAIPFERNKICGGPEARNDKTQNVILPDGTTCPIKDFVAKNYRPPETIWQFLKELPDNTLLCTGRQLIEALGGKSGKSRLFQIDVERKRIKQLL